MRDSQATVTRRSLLGKDTKVLEAEWLASTDPWSMSQLVERSKPSERKVRLFNAAICRRFWDHLPEASKAILSESELLADGLVPKSGDDMDLCWRANEVVAPFDRQYPTKQFPSAEVRIQRDSAAAVCYAVIPNVVRIQRDSAAAVCYAVVPNVLCGAMAYFWEIDPKEKGPQAVIIRDVFGNPLRPVAADPSWQTPDVVKLAKAIYDDRAFDQLPLLADALETAACTNAELLAHCRQPGLHVRGCWAVDLVLGKE
jgi:hypothetical protein